MNKKIAVLITILIVITLGIIAVIVYYQQDGESNQIVSGDIWQNPKFDCALKGSESPIKQYPSEPDQDYQESDLLEFCERMNELFENSSLTNQEADKIYQIIVDANFIVHGCYGMPPCNIGNKTYTRDQKIGGMKNKLALRKIDNNKYEIFFHRTGCGINYHYMEINIEDSQIIEREGVESWSASSPC